VSPRASLRARLRDPATHRSWALAANDGIIATAGLLLGFTGAGASDRLLLFTAVAATIAGVFSTAGAKWAEVAAEREAQLLIVEREQRDIERDPNGEVRELTEYWRTKGLSDDVARAVAEQLHTADALGAQLEWEYGFDEPLPRSEPIWAGAIGGIAYAVGALVPVLINYFAPVRIETWAILTAMIIAFVLTSAIASRVGQMQARSMLTRSLVVGGCTLIGSFLVGEWLI
jgi:VIT1/CCC1 family predicted Fe2+/Mn2+ transporter